MNDIYYITCKPITILGGSRAAMHRIPTFKRKSEADWDYFTDVKQVIEADGCKVEFHVLPRAIMELFSLESRTEGVMTIDDMMTLKLSHLPWDIQWHKNMSDYLVFKMKYGGKVNRTLYGALSAFWKVQHGNKPYLNLYRKKDEFFDDYVEKPYDHDHLHELVAGDDVPVYTRCLKDGQEVAIDRNKFDALPFDMKVKMFREEMSVIALERWILNPKAKGTVSLTSAWSRSVHKTVTALTKGWASEFICENLEHFVKIDHPLLQSVLQKLESEKS